MKRMRTSLSALALALAGLAAHAAAPAPVEPAAAPVAAAPTAAAPAAVAAQSASPSGPAASAAAKADPASGTRVLEDDRVRIEETRIRGQVQRVTVRSKLTGQDYEIIVGPGGRDPSQKSDAAGQRAWSVFRF